MADVHTKKQRSYNMSMIRNKDTEPELILRKLLTAHGIRGYRINYKLTGKPDIVFTKYKVAIFVDGCFWHKCPKCYREPDNNKEFWVEKINGNMKRDKKVNRQLGEKRWKVLRFWEHLLRKNPNFVCKKIIEELHKRKNDSENT